MECILIEEKLEDENFINSKINTKFIPQDYHLYMEFERILKLVLSLILNFFSPSQHKMIPYLLQFDGSSTLETGQPEDSRIESVIELLMKLLVVVAGSGGYKCPLVAMSSQAQWTPGHYIEYAT